MNMNKRTVDTLVELENANWFVKVGRCDSCNVHHLNSWSAAIKNSEAEAWVSLCQEAANQYRIKLAERDTVRFGEWNTIVREIKKETIPLVLRKTKGVVEANNLPQGFIDTVQWDILHLCMEAEYADVYPPGFFASQAYWYICGHFPCGWEGDFPNGRLIIF